MRLILALALTSAALAQQPKIIDAHVHHNGDPAFLESLLKRLEAAGALAFLMTAPRDLDAVRPVLAKHPRRLVGFGSIRLDDPDVLAQIDRFHAAGFRGLGEITGPLKNFDDKSYSAVYERAEKYGMIVLVHTGVVNRPNPAAPSDVSVDRMRVTTLDNIARRFPKLTLIGAHLGNPDYAWAAEIARWNPNLYFDLSGSTLIKKQEDYAFFKSVFWWSGVASPHTPKSGASAFEKVIFGSDVFGGDLDEFDASIERYRKMLSICGVPAAAQANIFSGTLWRILNVR
ncbi:MAG: amidohydrolase family protein [Bryobacteraceae bacterium]